MASSIWFILCEMLVEGETPMQWGFTVDGKYTENQALELMVAHVVEEFEPLTLEVLEVEYLTEGEE